MLETSRDLDFQYSYPEAHDIFNKFRATHIALVTIENKIGSEVYLKSKFEEITDDYLHIKQAFGKLGATKQSFLKIPFHLPRRKCEIDRVGLAHIFWGLETNAYL